MNSLFKTITSSHADDQRVVSFDAAETLEQKIFIEDLMLEMFIGVFDNEKSKKQRVYVNVELDISAAPNWREDNVENTVSYADIVELIEEIAASKNHIHLVETFAEMIIEECFKIESVQAAKITISKPDVMPQTKSVGVIISKKKN